MNNNQNINKIQNIIRYRTIKYKIEKKMIFIIL